MPDLDALLAEAWTKDTPVDAEMAAMLAAISDAWASASTPPELRQACLDFVDDENGRHQIDVLRAALLLTLGAWIIEGSGQGHDRHMLEQVAAVETHRCLSTLMRAAKERRGEAFIPARVAIVGYQMAVNVAKAEPFRCDIDGAVAAYDAAQRKVSDDDEEAA